MRITTERLAIEPISLKYLESTYAYSSDLENTRYMMFLPCDSIEDREAYIREAEAEWQSDAPHFLEFAILLGEAHIGGITLYLTEPGVAELGWILDKHHWGKGYAGEAVRAVMDYGRRVRGITRFFAQCDSENAASQRLMERLGMTYVGCTGGRKNRSSDEERKELTYEIYIYTILKLNIDISN